MSKALAFVEEVASRHGEDLGDGLVRVRRSQASLAAESACSAGTIAYYLRQAGPIVVRRDDGLVIDREALRAAQGDELARRRRRASEVSEALSQRWGRPCLGDDATTELVGPDGRSPSLREMADSLGLSPSTTQRHLETLERHGRLRRQGRRLYMLRPGPAAGAPGPAPADAAAPTPEALAGVDALNRLIGGFGAALVGFGQQLVELGQVTADAEDPSDNPRGGGIRGPRHPSAQLAESRDDAASLADTVPSSLFEKDKKSFFLQETANDGGERRGVRGPLPTPISQRTGRLSEDHDVTHALAPLVAACQQRALPHLVDEEGRRWLSLYSPDELARAVAELLRLLNNEGKLHSPLGLLVAKAKRGDESFFAEPATVPSGRVDCVAVEEEGPEGLPVDEEAAQAVAAMEPEELASLDEAIRAKLRIARLWESIEADPDQLAAHRCRTLRERWQSQGSEEAPAIPWVTPSAQEMSYAGAVGE